MTSAERRARLDELYAVLAEQRQTAGVRRLGDATGRDGWPSHGVYFFFEPGELREDGATPRVVRVGTHALTATSKTTLWTRLRTHRGRVGGRNPGGGNHRGSVFRLHVGTALIKRDGYAEAAQTWAHGSSAPREVRDREVELERAVSKHIGAMEVLCLDVPAREDRAAIERGCIVLLSNHDHPAVDPPSRAWLGHHADRDAIRRSGLWNVDHVMASVDPSVLRLVAAHVG